MHVEVAIEDQWLTVLVEDNGMGIEPSARERGRLARPGDRCGMRVRSFGGTLEIERLAAGGTRVRARLPLAGICADARAALADSGARHASAR